MLNVKNLQKMENIAILVDTKRESNIMPKRYIKNGGYQAYKLKYRKTRLNPFKEIIRERAYNSYEKCGWDKYYDILQTHHINRNRG